MRKRIDNYPGGLEVTKAYDSDGILSTKYRPRLVEIVVHFIMQDNGKIIGKDVKQNRAKKLMTEFPKFKNKISENSYVSAIVTFQYKLYNRLNFIHIFIRYLYFRLCKRSVSRKLSMIQRQDQVSFQIVLKL